MTRDGLRGRIQTVLGPIAPETLGRTLMHEHVLCDIRPPGTRGDNDLGPEITLENVWQMNYGRGLKRATSPRALRSSRPRVWCFGGAGPSGVLRGGLARARLRPQDEFDLERAEEAVEALDGGSPG